MVLNPPRSKTPAGTGYPHACLLPSNASGDEVHAWCKANLGASSSWSVRVLPRPDDDPLDMGLGRYGRYIVTSTLDQHVLAVMRWSTS